MSWYSSTVGTLGYGRKHGFFISIRHLELLCSFLYPAGVGVHGNAISFLTFFFPSDVVPSSHHSRFQPFRIIPFSVEVTFHCRTNGFSRICIPELSSG